MGEIQTYTAQDGLVEDAVRCVLKDGQGLLWFATAGGGLSRYDGRRRFWGSMSLRSGTG